MLPRARLPTAPSSGTAGLALLALAFGLFALRSARRRPPAERTAPARAQEGGYDPEDEGFDPASGDFVLGPAQRTFRRFRITQYYAAPLVLDAAGVELRDVQEQLLARVTPKSKHRLDTEGTGLLPSGRVLNVTGVQDRYQVLNHGLRGIGVKRRPLRPFLSVSTDQGGSSWKDSRTRRGPLVPVGTRLYILELDGYFLPDGTVHDGYVTADDVGDAVYGAHLELFVGRPEDQIHLPEVVNVSFPGIEEIPESYTYGLHEVHGPRGAYKVLRPPSPPRRVL